tara:strand:- start:2131 stop:2478 length:348 start_codon:yes stop_codon:yes gene_type:complete
MNNEAEKNGAETPQNGNAPRSQNARTLAYPTAQPSSQYEKSPLRSKKFLSFILSDLMWKGLIGLMVVTWQSAYVGTDLLLSAIIASAIVQTTYILTQAWVDRAVRLAEIEKPSNQ